MNNKELLDMAAHAAGIGIPDRMIGAVKPDGTRIFYNDIEGKTWRTWNPLEYDHDALRLAVKLGINIYLADAAFVTAGRCGIEGQREEIGNDPHAATRCAIVRAAAEIGRRMP